MDEREQRHDAWPIPRYGIGLRALGQRLDSVGAWNIMILDVGTGVVVRYSRQSVERTEHAAFTHEQLEGYGGDLESRRKPPVRQKGRVIPPPPRSAGYQDFLRSLGLRLEQERHKLVVLDEQSEGYIFSYLYIDPLRAFYPMKEFMELQKDEAGSLRDDAFSKRKIEEPKPSVWKRVLR